MKAQVFFWTFLSFLQADAQNIFERVYTSGSFEQSTMVVPTYDNGYFIAGNMKGSGGLYDWNTYLIKTNGQGDTLWTRLYGGGGYDLCVGALATADSGYAVLVNTDRFGNDDIQFIRLNNQGDTLWNKYYGDLSANNSEVPYGFASTADGGYIIVARTYVSNKGQDVYFIKTNASGDTLWTRSYGGNGDEDNLANKVIESYDGGYFILASTTSAGNGGTDFYLLKINNNGDSLWAVTFGTVGNDIPYHIEQTEDSGLILLGKFETSADTNTLTLIKTDKNGNLQWRKHPGTHHWDRGEYFQITPDKGLIITGTSMNGIKEQDVLLMRTDAIVDTLWTKKLGGTYNDNGIALCVAPDNGFGIVANTEGFGYLTNDIYFIKTDSAGKAGCPSPAFAASDNAICEEGMVSFMNTTRGTGSFTWLVNSSSFANTIHSYYYFQSPGAYKIQLVSCNDTSTRQVTVYPPLSADFNYTVNEDTVIFMYAPPANMQSIVWDFGDSTNMDSVNSNPMHIYGKTGLYAARLEVTDSNGCYSYQVKQIGIWPMGEEVVPSDINPEVKIYPNPFKERMIVSLLFTIYGLQLEIYNMLGDVVHTQTVNSKQETVNLSLPSGIYSYRVHNHETIIAQGKLVVVN